MVRIKRSHSKKRYLNGKHVYDYLRLHLPVPSRFVQRLKPYLKEDFQTDMTEDDAKIAFTYTYLKNSENNNKTQKTRAPKK